MPRLSVEDLQALAVTDRPEGARLSVQVKPRASRTSIVGVREGALVVAVAAPPVDGEANAALVRALADVLSVPVRSVAVAAGQTGKRKTIAVAGLTAAVVRERLAQG